MGDRPVALVSACLLGIACRYDGGAQPCPEVLARMDRVRFVPVCPEQLGGLPTPRAPAERRGERVVAADGTDVTAQFRRGAEQACRLAVLYGAKLAVLKSRSPSCGRSEIYDGTFSGRRVPGRGVTAEALDALGVRVIDESELETLDCEAGFPEPDEPLKGECE
ncbi:MAG: DUF523 domain-containing protein [Clostridia bacterium]|nr:DUF523 domain-containing protein [Clostridia bacterium]